MTRVAVVACGALATDVADAARELGWAVDVTVLDPLLHNRPDRIAPAVDLALESVRGSHDRAFVAYAQCGTGAALESILERHRHGGFVVDRLPGSHCYDVYAGVGRIGALLAEEPGTYFLTDYLIRAFDRVVVRELGLDRWPDLRDDYFGRYARAVWLQQSADPALPERAEHAAAVLGLPLQVEHVGLNGIVAALSTHSS